MPPSGIVTFLFTDIERSSSLWEARRDEMPAALELHDTVLREVVAVNGGTLFKHTGDGLCAAFSSIAAAVQAAVEGQRALAAVEWPDETHIGVRMGVHAGEAQSRDGDFFGPALNRCARVMDAGHGGQVLVSQAVEQLLRGALPPGITLRDLGEHELRGLASRERIYQVEADGLTPTFPPLRTAPTSSERLILPHYRSVFVGRHEQVEQLVALLGSERLVTLTGVGGCGKTRLAVEVAQRVAAGFADGVFFVDLAPISDGDLIPAATARAAGLQLGGGGSGSTLADLAAWLRERRTLLVVDNCEHLLDDAADFVDTILSAAPGVRVLATSREPLDVEGERSWRVPSLAAEGGAASEAVTLFVDRAVTARPDFRPGEADYEAIALICQRVDGIPLAIELAAARVAHLSPAEVSSRLDDRFRLLTGGRRRVARQQTLEAALDWSHDLLTADEQVLLRRVAVFPADFPLSGAEAVCGDDFAAPLVDLLGSLVKRSLVVVEDRDGVTRYRLLESVRAYASAKLLAAGEAELLRDAHAAWARGLLLALPADHWLDFEIMVYPREELATYRAALDWLRSQGRHAEMADMIGVLTGYWWLEGDVDEILMWVSPLLDGATLEPPQLAKVHLAAAVAGMTQGDWTAMEKHSAAITRIAGIEPTLRAAALGLQLMFWSYVDPDRAAERVRELEELRASGELGRMAATIEAFIVLPEIESGDLDAALRRLAPHCGPGAVGYVEWFANFATAAIRHIQGAHELAAEAAAGILADQEGVMNRYIRPLARALAQIGAGDVVGGRSTLAVATRNARRDGTPLAENDCLLLFAIAAFAEGDVRRARVLLTAGYAGGGFNRTPISILLARHYRGLIAPLLSAEERLATRAEGGRLGLQAALNQELARAELVRDGV